MRGKLAILTGLLRAAAILTFLFSAITSFPSVHHNIELFSHFRLQYLAVSALLWLVFIAMRNLGFSILLVVAVAINASYVVPWYLGDTASTAADPIKLMTVNVFRRNEQYGRLIDLIDAEQPDVIFLQEVSPEWLAALQALRSDYAFNYARPRQDAFGIAVFSRLKLDSVTHIDSPPLGYPTLVAKLTIGGEPLTLVNTHATVPLTRAGLEARNTQLMNVAQVVKDVPGAVILSGDFNTSMWSPVYRAVEDTSGLSNTRRGNGVLPSWPTFMPIALIPIDHVLVSDAVNVVETRLGRHIGSDHLPLIVTVAL